jgi:hypothetical protein
MADDPEVVAWSLGLKLKITLYRISNVRLFYAFAVFVSRFFSIVFARAARGEVSEL